MRIGIVTIYEPTTNMGSYLQAYALQETLTSLGHEVYFIQNNSIIRNVSKLFFKINPKREVFLRIKKAFFACSDIRLLKRIKIKVADKLDVIIFGSDEIWNIDNPYFNDGFFWGENVTIPKIAYAISVGAVEKRHLLQNKSFVNEVLNYHKILVRDDYTNEAISEITGSNYEKVCDPTMLIPLQEYIKPIACPKEKYMLVYTYGIDQPMIENLKKYAKKHNLKIISPCFWHIWADKVIECSALQFSSLIAGAECVFTTTFHGAVFTMLNHKRCCIFPVRPKVKEVVSLMGESIHLVDECCDFETFESTMSLDFDTERFERSLVEYRTHSLSELRGALECLQK